MLATAILLLAAPAPLGPAQAPARGEATAQPAGREPAAGPQREESTEPAPVPGEERSEAGQPPLMLVNRLELIVNDRCLTRRDVEIEVMRTFLRSAERPRTEQAQAELAGEIINKRVKEILKTQAGKDMGFDPAMVQRMVSDQLDRREELAGGVGTLGDELARYEMDSGAFQEDTESYIYSRLWTGSVQGYYAGPGGRPYVDTYVRPGKLWFEYERNKGRLALPATVTLQEIAIDAQRVGDLREARQLAEDLRQRILDGEDFGDVAVEAKAARKETRGVLEPIEEERLMGVPGLDTFLPEARPGDLSPVLPVRSPDGVLRGFRIVKLLERDRPEPPPFEDQDFQQQLTERIEERRDEIHAEVELLRLRDAAYVWPPEAFGREPAARDPEVTEPDLAGTAGGR